MSACNINSLQLFYYIEHQQYRCYAMYYLFVLAESGHGRYDLRDQSARKYKRPGYKRLSLLIDQSRRVRRPQSIMSCAVMCTNLIAAGNEPLTTMFAKIMFFLTTCSHSVDIPLITHDLPATRSPPDQVPTNFRQKATTRSEPTNRPNSDQVPTFYSTVTALM